jgi:hypothetical protein
VVRIYDVPREYVDIAEELTLVLTMGETPSDDLVARLEAFKKDGPGAIDAWVNCIKEQEAGVESIKLRTSQLANKKKALEKTIEYMRDVTANVVNTVCEGKFRGEWTVYTGIAKGLEVRVTNPAFVPKHYWKTPEPELKLADVKKAIAAGDTIPGVAWEATEKATLTIRS